MTEAGQRGGEKEKTRGTKRLASSELPTKERYRDICFELGYIFLSDGAVSMEEAERIISNNRSNTLGIISG